MFILFLQKNVFYTYGEYSYFTIRSSLFLQVLDKQQYKSRTEPFIFHTWTLDNKVQIQKWSRELELRGELELGGKLRLNEELDLGVELDL